jgi:hypothetical protein
MQELLASVAPKKANWDLKREVALAHMMCLPVTLITVSVSHLLLL